MYSFECSWIIQTTAVHPVKFPSLSWQKFSRRWTNWFRCHFLGDCRRQKLPLLLDMRSSISCPTESIAAHNVSPSSQSNALLCYIVLFDEQHANRTSNNPYKRILTKLHSGDTYFSHKEPPRMPALPGWFTIRTCYRISGASPRLISLEILSRPRAI